MVRISVFRYMTIWTFCCVIHAFKQYQMNQFCDQHVSMVTERIYGADITMEFNSDIITANRCNLTMEGWPDMPYLHFYFSDASMEDCSKAQVSVQTGSQTTLLTTYAGLVSICGVLANSIIGLSYTSTEKYLFLDFTWSSNADSPAFKFILNAYKIGDCHADEFMCHNGRCIHESLQCLGYDPCGDQSDCQDEGEINVIAIGVVSLIVLIFIVSYIKCSNSELAQRLRVCLHWERTDCTNKEVCKKCCHSNEVSDTNGVDRGVPVRSSDVTVAAGHEDVRHVYVQQGPVSPPPYSRSADQPPSYNTIADNPPSYSSLINNPRDTIPINSPPPSYNTAVGSSQCENMHAS